MDGMKNKALRMAKQALPVLIVAGIFTFFALKLYSSWNQLEYQGFAWGYALISVLGALLSLVFMAVIYYFILRAMKFNVGLGESINSHILGDFASYMPGKVWNVLARWRVLKGKVRIADSVVAITIEALSLIIAAALMSVLGLFFIEGFGEKYAFAICLGIPVIIILAHPKVIGFFANLFMKIIKKKQVVISITFRQVLITVLFCAAYWAINGVSFFFALKAVSNAAYSLLPVAVAANMIAWVIGFLGALTPAGLGIKEGAMVLLLSPYIPSHIVIAASIIFRIFTMAAILAAVAVIFLFFIKLDKLKSIKSYFKGAEDEKA